MFLAMEWGRLRAGGRRANQPDGPAPAVLPYAVGSADPTDVEWHTLADGVELAVPPPAVWRQLLTIVIEIAAGAAMAVLAGLFVVAAATSAEGAVLMMGVVLAVAIIWWIRAIRRMVGVARLGAWPTFVRTTGDRLTLMSPWLPGGKPVEIARDVITGLRVSEEGFPGLIRFIRLRVILRRGSPFTLRFPWCGGESVVDMEHRLRAALGFGPRNFSRHLEPPSRRGDPRTHCGARPPEVPEVASRFRKRSADSTTLALRLRNREATRKRRGGTTCTAHRLCESSSWSNTRRRRLIPALPPEQWPLSEEGKARCEVLARELAPLTPSVVVSSEEMKAEETGASPRSDWGSRTTRRRTCTSTTGRTCRSCGARSLFR